MSVSRTFAAAAAAEGEHHSIFIPSYYSSPDGSTPTPIEPTNANSEARDKAQSTARKGHKKSRGGCFTCKRQKLKCKENRPNCDYCAHRGIKCEWPTVLSKPRKRPTTETHHEVVSRGGMESKIPDLVLARPPKSIQLHDAPPVFTMEDMGLFNNFLQKSHPRHPRGNESIWTHEVPTLASKYDYLVHSMLALSASDLASSTCPRSKPHPRNLRDTSLYHRSKSITALNRAIQRGVNNVEEGNAMLATIFSLLIQSTYIGDGLVEYMTFIRGAIVVGKQMWKQHLNIVFNNVNIGHPPTDVQDDGLLVNAPALDEKLVVGCIRSLELCEGLLTTPLERKVHKVLATTARTLLVSSAHAYNELRNMYSLFAVEMTPTDFRTFTSPSSPSAQTFKVLQAHFVALQLIMEPVAAGETGPRPVCPVKSVGRAATAGWLVALHRDVERGLLKRYCVWTRWVEIEILGGRILNGSRARSACVFGEGDSPSSEHTFVGEIG